MFLQALWHLSETRCPGAEWRIFCVNGDYPIESGIRVCGKWKKCRHLWKQKQVGVFFALHKARCRSRRSFAKNQQFGQVRTILNRGLQELCMSIGTEVAKARRLRLFCKRRDWAGNELRASLYDLTINVPGCKALMIAASGARNIMSCPKPPRGDRASTA